MKEVMNEDKEKSLDSPPSWECPFGPSRREMKENLQDVHDNEEEAGGHWTWQIQLIPKITSFQFWQL